MCESTSVFQWTIIVIQMLPTILILMPHSPICKHSATGVGILQQEVHMLHLFRKYF